jgi:hypothetical protein
VWHTSPPFSFDLKRTPISPFCNSGLVVRANVTEEGDEGDVGHERAM